MANVVDDLGSPRRVPWPSFADGRIWELRRGEDFDQDARAAQSAAMAWARRNGYRTRSRAEGDVLRVQFLRSPAEGDPK